jgi:hypothetical protein
VRHALHWLLAFLIVVAPITSSAAYAAASAEAPCPMSASDDAGHSPCGDCGDQAASCAQVCAMLGAGLLVCADSSSLPGQCAERVAVRVPDLFRSHAGPPGLQPPR